MGEKELNTLMSMLTFLKIQNDRVLQLLIGDVKTYKKINKEIVKAWEKTLEDMLDEDKKEKRD